VNGRLPNPTHIAAPGAAANAQEDLNDRSRIELDDGNTWQNKDPITHPFPGLSASNTLRGGSTVTGLVGVLDYSHDIYRVQPVDDVIFSNDNPRPAFPTAVGGTLKVASFNVLNYFNGDGLGGGFPTPRGAESASEFTRQRVKIVTAILTMDADVIGLMEIENDGYGTESAVADLVNGLNDVVGKGTYAYIDPGVSAIGTDAIAVGFIYKPATVTLIGASAILDASVDPTFNDDKNRPALAQTFQENATAGRFTAVVNHFKSKGSDCNSLGDPDIGDGQGNCNLTRTSAAVALANWLATDPTSSNDPDYLILGDLNSYAMEDPISALTSAGYTDLAASLIGSSAFSYVFAGEWGYLDYAMSNGSLTAQVTGVTEWHINADEPPVLDYNENYKSAGQITSLYSPDAYRSSDHDPVVIGLELTIEQEVNELIDAVQALVDDGTLNGGQGNALTKKLENVLAKLAKGNTNAAANQLDAFINQVEDYVNGGILTAEQGDALIEAATALVEVLNN
jgi:predicted extracellular nuclease